VNHQNSQSKESSADNKYGTNQTGRSKGHSNENSGDDEA
tara:strand:- start:157 stop:273 length:117 start_codon:yes stop_codon:yes gene_type:complete